MTQHKQALQEHLKYLKLPYLAEHYKGLAKQAASEKLPHIDYLEKLVEGEVLSRQDRAIKRRISQAKFPFIRTLDSFEWNFPDKINRLNIQNLFRLKFIDEPANIIFLGTVGTGKTHLSISLGYQACLANESVLFSSAIDVINSLSAAQAVGRLKQEMTKYIKPRLLILDELGYLPIDKQGADLLFQIISQRYERGAMIITSNRAYKDWPKTFNNDSTLTSAILDRLLHRSETEVIEGKSYRMKDRIKE